jgi:hypothetical protein
MSSSSCESQAQGLSLAALPCLNLMYADDVTLLAWTHADAQRLLDCLSLFCKLFDMEVNLAKTHALVFRRPRAARPTAALLYRGEQLAFAESCTYLGLHLHATKGFTAASDKLAIKGRKAMLGLLPLLKLHHITQCDLRLRMFDILVEPVVSYGAHIWGPSMCSSWLSCSYDGRGSACAADEVQFAFLRELYGAHRNASRDVLLRDTHRVPLPFRWLSLAASWWAKLADMEPDRLALSGVGGRPAIVAVGVCRLLVLPLLGGFRGHWVCCTGPMALWHPGRHS